jgi:hypothetical protein
MYSGNMYHSFHGVSTEFFQNVAARHLLRKGLETIDGVLFLVFSILIFGEKIYCVGI